MKDVRRSHCPIACALDLIGDKWTLLVIRDLSFGKTHFKEFTRSPEGIATNILADRLSRLTAVGLVEKQASPGSPGRDAYHLTAKGLTLLPVLESVARWGLANLAGTASMPEAVRLRDRPTPG